MIIAVCPQIKSIIDYCNNNILEEGRERRDDLIGNQEFDNITDLVFCKNDYKIAECTQSTLIILSQNPV
ncbi:MAG: hypothetical protein ACUZ8I_10285 [Candidatus Scalindua sp.]